MIRKTEKRKRIYAGRLLKTAAALAGAAALTYGAGSAAAADSSAAADTAGGSVTVSSGMAGAAVLVDNEACRVSITGLDTDPSDGITWTVHMVNRLGEPLHAGLGGAAIGGRMCDAGINLMAEAYEEADGELTWTQESLAKSGVQSVPDADIILSVAGSYDMAQTVDTWTKVYGKYHIEVEDTGAAEDSREALDSGEDMLTVSDHDGLRVFLREITAAEDPNGKPALSFRLEAENTSGEDRVFRLDNLSVNGLIATAEGLYPGECTVFSGATAGFETIFASEGIQDPEEVTMLSFDFVEGAKLLAAQDDENGWVYGDRKLLDPEHRTLFPKGEEQAAAYERPASAEDVPLLDEGGLKICAVRTDTETYGEFGLASAVLYLENNTPSGRTVRLDSMQVDGAEAFAYLMVSLEEGQRCFAEVSFPFAPGAPIGSIRMLFSYGEGDLTGADVQTAEAEYTP